MVVSLLACQALLAEHDRAGHDLVRSTRLLIRSPALEFRVQGFGFKVFSTYYIANSTVPFRW